ncbi:hypothetical protein CDD82_4579 [Ophiocordyceps australis]|uniref:protein disulfide-isomerase n=1 Tax=Ophiocordyceps australis TaxID=1399860 RepID=A0A2C5ZS89_9HYPO|nr:hypothetical protein CDD82_4579 [Ophiocordyceps australis]
MHHHSLAAAAAALLATLPACQAAMYTKKSPVLQIDANSYGPLIAKSNYTSIIEFYAPWCGHCQNLKPIYEKLAEKLQGRAKVAAVDCDDDGNKQFCGHHGVKGFPTLKIVRPGKGPASKPTVQDYQGQRTVKSMADAVLNSINNHVIRVTDEKLDAFIASKEPKALLFTEKGTTSGLLRSIAIDFLGVIKIGQVRDKDTAVVEKFGIDKFPTLILIPGDGEDAIVYHGELNKEEMVKFLSQAGQPNPDPAPVEKAKGDGPSSNKASKASDEKKSKTSDEKKKKKNKVSDKSSDKAQAETSSASPTKESTPDPEESAETSTASETAESTRPSADIISITTVDTKAMVVEKCLKPKSHSCVLAFIPSKSSEGGDKVLAALSHLNTKYIHGKRHVFPFLALPDNIDGSAMLRETLNLGNEVEMIALNARRLWWKRYEGDFSHESVENWIDSIRMGEGKKSDLPETVLDKAEDMAHNGSQATEADSSTKSEEDSTAQSPTTESSTSQTLTEATQATDPQPESETQKSETQKSEEEVVHEEL